MWRRIAWTIPALALSAPSDARESGIDTWPAPGGVSIQLDNDLFAGTDADRDYSWSLSVTLGSPASTLEDGGSRAVQLGLLAMTPDDLNTSAPQPADRPYASLLYVAAARMQVAEHQGRARYTNVTIGMLGLGAAESVQKSLHEAMNGELPRGWHQQVSAGGEPTARIAHARQWLTTRPEWSGDRRLESKLTLGASAGYLTEASAAFSARWGAIHTPWWSFNPELTDYTAAPIIPLALEDADPTPEHYFFVGVRAKARAYNSLLQGQFRESPVRVSSAEVARIQGEAWVGFASNIARWEVSYRVHVASPEVKSGAASRTMVWASLGIQRRFAG